MNGAKRALGLSILLVTVAAPAAAQTAAWRPGEAPVKIMQWTYRHDEPAAGAWVQAPLDGAGFTPYDSGHLDPAAAAAGQMITFRFDLDLSAADPAVLVGLFLGPGSYPRVVYLNGVALFEAGSHTGRYSSTIYYSSRILLPPQLLRYDRPNAIAVEAYPEENYPLGDVLVGDFNGLARLVFLRNLFNLHLVQASVVVALMIALFYSFMFLASPNKDRRYLYFALVAIAFAFGYSNMSLFYDAADEAVLEKLSRCGLVFTSFFLFCFALEFTGLGRKRHRWFIGAAAVPTLISAGLTVLQPTKAAVAALFGGFSTNFVLTPLLLVTLGILVAGFVRRRAPDTALVLAGYLLAVAASLHDIYYISIGVAPFCYLVAYGYLLMIMGIFFILALEQSSVARALATQSDALNVSNRTLGEILEELTGVSGNLVASSAGLETTLTETLGAVTAYGEENRAISAAFRSQMAEVEAEIARVAGQLAASAERVPQATAAQTAAARAVNDTMDAMRSRIGENLASAGDSSRLAGQLAADADESARVIGQSRQAISLVAEHSGSLHEVLSAIEDIAERTHVLSINAAIESARLGKEGKGFGVVAQEIRQLSDQSRGSLKSSFDKIGDMTQAVARGAALSDQAAKTLKAIAEQARASAASTEAIRRQIETQGAQSSEVARLAADLLAQAQVLTDLSRDEQRANAERDAQFRSIVGSLAGVTGRLDRQDARTRDLFSALDRIRAVMGDNAGQIGRLRISIEKARR